MPVIARTSTEIVSISADCSEGLGGEFKSLDTLTSGKGGLGFSENAGLVDDTSSLVIGISTILLCCSSSLGRTSKRVITRVRVPAGDGVGVASSFNGGKTIAEYLS